MKIHYGLDQFQTLNNAVVTSGTFDGLHKGHQIILKRLKHIARKTNGESVVITFWPHPRFVIQPKASKELKLLSSVDEKIELFRSQHIDHLIILPFTKEFSNISSQQFIENIIVCKIGTKKLVIGYDHRFGKNREGSFEYLKKNADQFGIEVEEIPRQDVENVGISSTKIREALSHGEIEKANQLLGYSYFITGQVIIGEQIGRTIGFPTANIQIIESKKLIPKDGVYAIRIIVHDEIYDGMLNIGFRPTVNGQERTIEAHIFDFNKDIYRKFVKLSFVRMIREEQRFENLDALQHQLVKDKEAAKALLDNA